MRNEEERDDDAQDGWEEDFPIRDEVEDCTGRTRTFMIECYGGGFGFTVRAREEVEEGEGYEFGAHSETSPYSALGRLRQKMRRCLAMRHVTGAQGNRRMLHDRLSGRIAYDEEDGVQLVVDGLPLKLFELVEILRSHEGWEFDLQITDALE